MLRFTTALLLTAAPALARPAGTPTYILLDPLPNHDTAIVENISPDNRFVLGESVNSASAFAEPTLWSIDGRSITDLGLLNDFPSSIPAALSVNASAFALTAGNDTTTGPAYYQVNASRLIIPQVGVGTFMRPFGISADGATVVGHGTVNATNSQFRVWRWSQNTGTLMLPVPAGALNSETFLDNITRPVSDDGNIIIGNFATSTLANRHGFIFTASTNDLAILPAVQHNNLPTLVALSATGSTLAGFSTIDFADGSQHTRSFRWTADTGFVDLGTLAAHTEITATDMSADASTIIGRADDANFIWTQAGGMASLDDLVNASGLLAPDKQGFTITRLSSDGTTLVGTVILADNTRRGFVLSLTGPAACNLADIVSVGQQPPADGLLTGDDYVAFINAFFTGDLLADVVSVGQQPPPDNLLTGDDYVAFINSFFTGCP